MSKILIWVKLKIKSFSDISNIVHNFKDLRVLLVGETIIDEYTYCDAIGKSSKRSGFSIKGIRNTKISWWSISNC